MSMNLFSMFDSHMYFFSPIFLMGMFFMLMQNFNQDAKWSSNSNTYYNMLYILNFINKELKNEMNMLKKNSKTMGIKKLFMNLIIMIFFFNIYSLYPFIFSITSHISINFPISLILWMSTVMMAMKMSWKNFLSHLTPMGTPMALMSFMVLIETISNLIRPITLSVRLMANMVAGHLLLLLLSNFSMISMSNAIMCTIMMLILSMLEMGVSLVQSYVLTLLIILYFKEAF